MHNLLKVTFIYEDKDIIAIEKPAGLPVIAPENRKTRNALDIVTKHLQIKNPKGRAAVVHRLDRDTSGIMIFAKNAKSKALLMKNWNHLIIKRCYIALAEGTVPETTGTIESWILETSANRVKEVAPHTKGALRAITHYKLIQSTQKLSLLELELETGRRHQIRVQLADLGHPIAGDTLYGAHTDPFHRLCLHASLLELKHPTIGTDLVLESSPPEFALSLQ